jgi:hypothetical protein
LAPPRHHRCGDRQLPARADVPGRRCRQIDAADYALQHLLNDLCVAMPIPADGSALRAFLATAEAAAACRRSAAA